MRKKFGKFLSKKSGYWYWQDNDSRKSGELRQGTLGTKNEVEADRLLHAKNEAHLCPGINIQMARAYLAAADPAIALRTWQFVMDEVLKTVRGPTRDRWQTAIKDPAYTALKSLPLAETRAEHFLKALHSGTVATNVFLRRLHNFVLDMSWLPWPAIPKRQWPPVRYKEKRAITADEHRRIVERETNPERRLFYELFHHLTTAKATDSAEPAEGPTGAFLKAHNLTNCQFNETRLKVVRKCRAILASSRCC